MNNVNLIGIKDSDRHEHKFVIVMNSYGFAVYRNNDLCMVERKKDNSEGVVKAFQSLGYNIEVAKVNDLLLNRKLKGLIGFPEKLSSLMQCGVILN